MKVAIARALVHDPDTILLDEPTNGLDIMSVRTLRDAACARCAAQGKCLLFSSHVMQEVAALCDRIVDPRARPRGRRGHRRRACRARGHARRSRTRSSR